MLSGQAVLSEQMFFPVRSLFAGSTVLIRRYHLLPNRHIAACNINGCVFINKHSIPFHEKDDSACKENTFFQIIPSCDSMYVNAP